MRVWLQSDHRTRQRQTLLLYTWWISARQRHNVRVCGQPNALGPRARGILLLGEQPHSLKSQLGQGAQPAAARAPRGSCTRQAPPEAALPPMNTREGSHHLAPLTLTREHHGTNWSNTVLCKRQDTNSTHSGCGRLPRTTWRDVQAACTAKEIKLLASRPASAGGMPGSSALANQQATHRRTEQAGLRRPARGPAHNQKHQTTVTTTTNGTALACVSFYQSGIKSSRDQSKRKAKVCCCAGPIAQRHLTNVWYSQSTQKATNKWVAAPKQRSERCSTLAQMGQRKRSPKDRPTGHQQTGHTATSTAK